MAAAEKTDKTQSNAWAWPAGILLGLVIGISSFGAAVGVAFGVAIGIAFAIAFGGIRNRAQGHTDAGDPQGDGSTGRHDAGPGGEA
ncbi:hypothetical protein ACFYL6_19460 [Micromonospora sp. NPDC007208]|uniref:hypothetical protein n=1 Tax=Micromonospora sp. NPDC007208 TaxID=3364236 RepID=UPI0036744511